MRILVAPDSFKGSLDAPAAAQAIARGVRRACPACEIEEMPIADGGEGTLDVLIRSTRGSYQPVEVRGPLGEPVSARFGILGDGKTGVIEMAQASGLTLVPLQLRNPLRTSSFGTGQLITAALNRGLRRLIITIGGSATVDGGLGLLAALGARPLDRQGKELDPIGGSLLQLADIDIAGLDARLRQCEVIVASDVTNPLVGEQGAAAVFGPQKGATPQMVTDLDRGLERLGEITQQRTGVSVLDLPGGGAAGGLGAALVAYLGGKLTSGIDVVLDACQVERRLPGVSLIITGEGRIDAQTAAGKAPAGIAQRGRRHGCRTIALAGSLGAGYAAVYNQGIDGVFPILAAPLSLDESMERAAALLEDAAARVMHLYLQIAGQDASRTPEKMTNPE